MRKLGLTTIVAIAVIAVGGAELVDGAVSAGVAIDEPTQLERTFGWIDQGWYVPGPFLVDGNPDPHNVLASPFVYGPAFSSLAHAVNVEVGNEPIGNVSFAAGAFVIRHLLVAVLAALAAAAAGATAWFLTQSWRFGLWATACLLAIPAWMGQGFVNLKDIPVGTGYTLVTAALVLALVGKAPSRRRRVAIAALLAGGIFIGVGTRLAMWAPFLASVLSYALLRVGQRWRGATASEWGRDRAVLAGGAVGLAATAALYPKVFETPRTLLTHSISTSAEYQNKSVTLTAGQLLSEHPPWWYLPTWIGASLPLLIGALAVFGAVLAIGAMARARARGVESVWGRRELGAILVLQQACLLPLISIAGNATIYDAVRQHLYVFPALAILAALGAERFWRWAQSRRAKAWPALAAVGLTLALAAPLVEQSILFPYNYTYINPLAGIRGVNKRWETDYWYTSSKEALSRVPRGATLRCSTGLVRPSEPDQGPGFGLCDGGTFKPFLADRGTSAGDSPPTAKTWVISWPRGGNRPPPWCEEAADVTRWLRGEEVIMAYVLRCDPRRVRQGESSG